MTYMRIARNLFPIAIIWLPPSLYNYLKFEPQTKSSNSYTSSLVSHSSLNEVRCTKLNLTHFRFILFLNPVYFSAYTHLSPIYLPIMHIEILTQAMYSLSLCLFVCMCVCVKVDPLWWLPNLPWDFDSLEYNIHFFNFWN